MAISPILSAEKMKYCMSMVDSDASHKAARAIMDMSPSSRVKTPVLEIAKLSTDRIKSVKDRTVSG
jgi:hypothetical protein